MKYHHFFKALFCVFSLGLVACSNHSAFLSSPAKVITAERATISTSPNLSLNTKSVLISSGYTPQHCFANFQTCLDDTANTYLKSDDKNKLAVFAELYYAYALSLKNSPACQGVLERPPIDPNFANAPLGDDEKLQKQQAGQACRFAHLDNLYHALRHSYAYMFYDNLNQQSTTNNIANQTQVGVQDIYHMAIYDITTELKLQEQGSFGQANIATTHQNHDNPHHFANTPVQVASITLPSSDTPTTLNLYLDGNPQYLNQLEKGVDTLSYLSSVYDTTLANLDVTSTRSGIGVGYVGALKNRHQSHIKQVRENTATDISQRIHPMGHLLMTAVIIPTGDSVEKVLKSNTLNAYFINPYDSDTITILGQEYPLFANFSSGYAKWLNEHQFRELALANMVAKKPDAHLPELFMLEPYNPNKKVIIMIHGLASSPRTWVQATNSLLADPQLQEHYQVWQVFYSTNLPILENRYHIQELIKQTFKETDPDGNNPASHNTTIIAHSMGAVISRLMLSNDNLLLNLDNLKDSTHSSQLDKLLSDTYHNDEFSSRFVLSPLPQVDTAVFISAPFRGTDYADRWFTRGIRRIIHLPIGLTQTLTKTLGNLGDTASDNPLGALYLQNGASQLSDKSAFMALTKNITISPTVRYHLIMANNTHGKDKVNSAISEHISDGIVPYTSSHLEGADSEIILQGGHSIHENPQTILHLRQILHAKLDTTNTPQSQPIPFFN